MYKDAIALIGGIHAQPDIIKQHPELLEVLELPGIAQGEADIADFQVAQIARLREQLDVARHEREAALASLRNHHSLNTAVRQLVIGLMQVQEFESLLRWVGQDIPSQMGVDLAMLLVESPLAAAQDAVLAEAGLDGVESGMRLVDPQSLPIQHGNNVRCVSNAAEQPLAPGWELAPNAADLLASQALLPLDLPRCGLNAAMIIGTRQEGYFADSHAAQPLEFFAAIVAHHLDTLLARSDLRHAITVS